MKIIILTSDILDGLIITQKIVDSGKDVRAVIFERKPFKIKPFIKKILFNIKGHIGSVTYKGIVKNKKAIIVKPVDNINSPGVKDIISGVNPDLMVVIGTGKISKEVFELSQKGTINMHSGILPFYRGADSEFWALYNDEKEKIGVTIHFINEGLDTGDIILEAKQEVMPDDNHKTLRMKNIFLGAEKMVEAIGMIETGDFKRTPQDNSLAKTYKSATAEDILEYRDRR